MNEDENNDLEEAAFLEEEEDSISPELDQFMKEQEEAEETSNDLDDLMDNWEEEEEETDDFDLDDIEEESSDPLTEFEGEQQAPTERVEQVKERISSEKNNKNLERLGAKFLDQADLFKASLCSKLSGQHMAEYVADDDMKAILIDCIKEYLATKEVTEVSPFGALMAALAMWTLPPLGVALLDRFQLQQEKKASPQSSNPEPIVEDEQEVAGEAKTDYSHLKEVQEGRKMFSLNAEGKYNRTPKGTYIKVEIADEFPSPEVQELIDQGLKDREIKKVLGYG